MLSKGVLHAFEGSVCYYWYLYLIATKYALYIARGYRLQLITHVHPTVWAG
jgi:hypothetical protein